MFIPSFRVITRCLAICPWLVCAMLCGCMQSTPEEEAEHVIPAHRPTSLRQATWQLVTRWQQFAQIDEPTRLAVAKWQQEPLVPPSSPDIASSELSDIVRWLPEVAAETELNRAQWEQVATLTVQLEQHLPGLKEPAGAAKTGAAPISGLLAELAKLAEADVSYEELIQARDSKRSSTTPAIAPLPVTTASPATTVDPATTTNGAPL